MSFWQTADRLNPRDWERTSGKSKQGERKIWVPEYVSLGPLKVKRVRKTQKKRFCFQRVRGQGKWALLEVEEESGWRERRVNCVSQHAASFPKCCVDTLCYGSMLIRLLAFLCLVNHPFSTLGTPPLHVSSFLFLEILLFYFASELSECCSV